MADQEVETWIRTTTSTSAVTTTAITTLGCSNDLERNSVISLDEDDGSISQPLEGTATPQLHSDALNSLPLPFPLPQDLMRIEENVPRAGVPLIYLQRQCPI